MIYLRGLNCEREDPPLESLPLPLAFSTNDDLFLCDYPSLITGKFENSQYLPKVFADRQLSNLNRMPVGVLWEQKNSSYC